MFGRAHITLFSGITQKWGNKRFYSLLFTSYSLTIQWWTCYIINKILSFSKVCNSCFSHALIIHCNQKQLMGKSLFGPTAPEGEWSIMAGRLVTRHGINSRQLTTSIFKCRLEAEKASLKQDEAIKSQSPLLKTCFFQLSQLHISQPQPFL